MTKYIAYMRVMGANPGDTFESYDPEQSEYLATLVEKGKIGIVEEVSDGGTGLAPDGSSSGADVGLDQGPDAGSGGSGERGSTPVSRRHREAP